MTLQTIQTVLTQLESVKPRQEALAYLATQTSMTVKVADRYDDDALLRDAISKLIPDFEYPDISYLTMTQLYRKCRKIPDPVILQLKQVGAHNALSNLTLKPKSDETPAAKP